MTDELSELQRGLGRVEGTLLAQEAANKERWDRFMASWDERGLQQTALLGRVGKLEVRHGRMLGTASGLAVAASAIFEGALFAWHLLTGGRTPPHP